MLVQPALSILKFRNDSKSTGVVLVQAVLSILKFRNDSKGTGVVLVQAVLSMLEFRNDSKSTGVVLVQGVLSILNLEMTVEASSWLIAPMLVLLWIRTTDRNLFLVCCLQYK